MKYLFSLFIFFSFSLSTFSRDYSDYNILNKVNNLKVKIDNQEYKLRPDGLVQKLNGDMVGPWRVVTIDNQLNFEMNVNGKKYYQKFDFRISSKMELDPSGKHELVNMPIISIDGIDHYIYGILDVNLNLGYLTIYPQGQLTYVLDGIFFGINIPIVSSSIQFNSEHYFYDFSLTLFNRKKVKLLGTRLVNKIYTISDDRYQKIEFTNESGIADMANLPILSSGDESFNIAEELVIFDNTLYLGGHSSPTQRSEPIKIDNSLILGYDKDWLGIAIVDGDVYETILSYENSESVQIESENGQKAVYFNFNKNLKYKVVEKICNVRLPLSGTAFKTAELSIVSKDYLGYDVESKKLCIYVQEDF